MHSQQVLVAPRDGDINKLEDKIAYSKGFLPLFAYLNPGLLTQKLFKRHEDCKETPKSEGITEQKLTKRISFGLLSHL